MSERTDPVVVRLRCEANPSTETQEIDRAEWNAMTPSERAKMLDDMTAEHVNNSGGYGWHIPDTDDESAVGSTPVMYPIDSAVRDRLARHLHMQSTATMDECRSHADAILAVIIGKEA